MHLAKLGLGGTHRSPSEGDTMPMLDHEYLTPSEVARRVAKATEKKPFNKTTVFRWRTKGIATPAGFIKLRGTSIAGQLCIEAAELERFLAAVAAAKEGGAMPAETQGVAS